MMFLARLAYLRALRLSSRLRLEGLTQTKSRVLWLPPRLPLRIRVSLESRKGTNFWADPCRLLAGSMVARAEMTFPRTSSPLLMSMPSLRRVPSAPVLLARSDPARSTKLNLDLVVTVPRPRPRPPSGPARRGPT